MTSDEEYMRIAIEEAKKATNCDEVPVGAIIVKDGVIIAAEHNLKESLNCAIYHAEILAIERACLKLGTWRLNDCEMYVTLEPCPMCSGAMINSRLGKLVFGAYDLKAGCCGTLYNLPKDCRFNHAIEVQGGVLQYECGKLLTDYFRGKRYGNKAKGGQGKTQEANS